MFNKLRYNLYQKWFCKEFVKRSKEIACYEQYLKHISKEDSLHTNFYCVALYDVLDNEGMNVLIRQLYKLKKSKHYDVDTSYIKHSFRKVNYINSNITGRQTGNIGTVKMIEDNWLSEIRILYTYLNNSEIVVEYSFCFKKVINTYLQIHQFIIDNIKKAKKEWYFHTYADKSIIEKADYKELLQLDDIFFADILQSFICGLFYTNYGKHYKLPIEYCLKPHRYNQKKAMKIRKSFLCECYEKEKQHLVVCTLNYDRYEVTHYRAGKYLPDPVLIRYFTDFPTEMFYKSFGDIELQQIEKHMRKYLNSKKSFISAKDIKWLVNKIRCIREQLPRMEHAFKEKNSEHNLGLLGWQCYIHGNLQKEDFIDYPNRSNYFLELYEQNLQYLNSIASVQNNTVIVILAVAGIIATIVGIVISALLR